MKLRCQSKGTNCPPFKHNGTFYPDNENIKRLLPDLNRCADCMAYVAPTLPYFRDDFLQIAAITLLEKGAAFDPAHESRASFGTFIRPRICINLTNTRRKEFIHHGRERLEPIEAPDIHNKQIPKPTQIWRSCQTLRIPNRILRRCPHLGHLNRQL